MKMIALMTLTASLVTAPLFAQPPVPPRAASPGTVPTGSAIVRGRITTAEGKPLRRATVSLQATVAGSPAAPKAVSTNAQGGYEIRDVPPGSYRVNAIKAGYLTVQYGQRRALEQGRPIVVKNGDRLERVDISMPKGAVITGQITDELGEPYEGVRMEVLEQRFVRGQLVPFPAGVTYADDQGRYRIPNLAPGTFYVMAATKDLLRMGRDRNEVYSYGFSYYSSSGPERAEPITLSAGQVRTGVDMRLTPLRTARVSGTARSETGATLGGRSLALSFTYPGTGASANPPTATTRTAPDGSFLFENIPSGSYRLGGAGAIDVNVNGADVPDIQLVLRTPSNIAGSVVTEDGTPPPFPPAGTRVLLEQGSGPVLPTVRVQQINTDWSFMLADVGGSFLFRLSNLRDGWMVNKVTRGDEDITDADWDVPTGSQKFDGLTIHITRRVASITGTVVDRENKATADAAVVLFPDDERLWHPASRYIRTTKPDDAGRFTIGQLPAGSYRLATRDFVQTGQEFNVEFLRSLRANSAAVELLEGGTGTVNLQLR